MRQPSDRFLRTFAEEAHGYGGEVRLTEFRERMAEAFGGRLPAETFAHDHVLSSLGNRTVDQALADGEDARRVWTAVVEEMELPQRLR